MTIILGLESSCDETAAALVTADRRILAHALAGQADSHAPFGGVVPEIAARAHVDRLMPLVEQALSESGVKLADVDAIAATAGPGTGNITLPSLLENQAARRLAPLYASPCRNSGDPASPNDADGSRTDMGALLALPENLQSGEVRWTRSG